MLSLPLITPRDVRIHPAILLFSYVRAMAYDLTYLPQSHELWFSSSNSYRSSHSSSQQVASSDAPRRHALPNRVFASSATPSNTLAALLLEERALRSRKQNIASFGYTWLKPAGYPKTMLGVREEEVEREEGLAAVEIGTGVGLDGTDMTAFGDGLLNPTGTARDGVEPVQMMERDLDDAIPDADMEAEGLVEEGEEGLEEDEDVDDSLMERNLDDDIPFPDDDDDDDNGDFDDQSDLDGDLPPVDGGEGLGGIMVRDLDDDVPDAAADGSDQEEWQHTDTDAEDVDDEDDNGRQGLFTEHFQRSTPSNRSLPSQPVSRETDAQRRFLDRWSGGGDALDSSGIMLDDEDLRASITSQGSRRAARVRGTYPNL